MSAQSDINKAAADSAVAAEKAKAASAIMEKFAKGTDTEQVDNGLPGGIPSLAKFIKTKDQEINEAGDGILAESRAARDVAVESAEQTTEDRQQTGEDRAATNADAAVSIAQAAIATTKAGEAAAYVDLLNATSAGDPLTPVAQWSDVPALEGGPEQLMAAVNAQGQAVTNRTAAIADNTNTTRGAALVGYYDPVAPTYLKTVSDIINGLPVSALRGLPKDKHADIMSGVDTTDYTTNLNDLATAIVAAGGGELVIPRGVIYVKNFTIPKFSSGDPTSRMILSGYGRGSYLRMTQAGATADDATIVVDGFYWSIRDLVIQGVQTISAAAALTVGHAVKVIPQAGGGIKGSVKDCMIGRVGQNGIHVVANSNPSWELVIDGCDVSYCGGLCVEPGTANDSKIIDTYLAFGKVGALALSRGNTAWKVANVKAYGNRSLSWTDFAYNRVVPAAQTEAADSGSVILTGYDHTISNLEIQENGSIGLQLGTSSHPLANSALTGLSVSGNGGWCEIGSDDGYGGTTDATTQANYRRLGILGVNYYRVGIKGECNDFRAKYGKPRQYAGYKSTASRPTKTSGSLPNQSWWRIINNSGGADFTGAQLGYANPSNAVGTIFQSRKSSPAAADPTPTYGTGSLEAVNDGLNIQLEIVNQWNQDNLTGASSLGYDFASDGGNSFVVVNGRIVADVALVESNSPRVTLRQVGTGGSSELYMLDANSNGGALVMDMSGTPALKAQTISAGNVLLTPWQIERANGRITVNKAGCDTSGSFQVVSTGFLVAFGDTTGLIALDPAGTLATGTITMPASPLDGQIATISSTQTVTALTLSPNTGQSIKAAAMTILAGQTLRYRYRASNTTWYPA